MTAFRFTFIRSFNLTCVNTTKLNEQKKREMNLTFKFSLNSSILVNGLAITAFCHIFLTYSPVASLFSSHEAFLTAFFSFFIFVTTINAFNVRTNKINILDSLLLNKNFIMIITLIFGVQIAFTWIGGSVLRTVPLTLYEWGIVIAASAVIIPFDMVRKALLNPLLPKND